MMRALRMLPAVAVATFAAAAAAPPAHAADGTCGGNLIFTKAIKDDKDRKLGELNVYFNPANGNNCARTVHSDRTWGQAMRTTVALNRCYKGIGPGDPCFFDPDKDERHDTGSFKYFAGPVSINAENRCIWAIGWIKGFYASTRPDQQAAFCG
jgi:hypothetical protein